MSRGVNRVIVVGFLGKDPEVRNAQSGTITNISVATTETWKDRNTGEKKEATEWHRIVFFGRIAEIAGEYLKKGSQVYIEGRLQTRKWQDKDGKDRYTTEIIAGEMQMLGSRDGRGSASADYGHGEHSDTPAPSAPRSGGMSANHGSGGHAGDDIPFAMFERGSVI